MRKSKIIAFLLSIIISLGLLCSCTGNIGPQGPQGETGHTGKDGASFLTGNGEPSNKLGKVGDSYLDITGDDLWGFYIKDENGWKLVGYILGQPAPLTFSDFNGSYECSHAVVEEWDSTTQALQNVRYNIGEDCHGLTLHANMLKMEIQDGVGTMSYDIRESICGDTNITYTVEDDKFIMVCEDEVIAPDGNLQHRFEFSIVQDGGEIYLVLKSGLFSYYVKKVS